MAVSLITLANQIRTSLHGRRLGLDKDGLLVGNAGLPRLPISDATTATTATGIAPYGNQSVVTTTNTSWTMAGPALGAEVTLMTGTTSTGTHTIVSVATIVTSAVANATSIAMAGGRAALTLYAVSTSQWLIKNSIGSVTITTV